ncbi:MAG: PEP-CTERM sorting domain-containing protein [Pirellulaceae bacterium]
MSLRPSYVLSCAAIAAITFLTANPAAAETINVVSPPEYELSDAPDASLAAPDVPVRFQVIEAADVFTTELEGVHFLSKIATRPDAVVPVGSQVNFERLQIRVGVTSVDPANMSDTFANNVTSPLTLVYDGPWSGSVTNPQPAGDETRPFDYVFPFDTSFRYNPADGNLIVDWIVEGQTSDLVGNSSLTDVNFDYTGPQSWKWTLDRGAESPVGFGEFAIVTQYSFTPVPEPNTAALVALGGLVAGFAKRARRKNCEGRMTNA